VTKTSRILSFLIAVVALAGLAGAAGAASSASATYQPGPGVGLLTLEALPGTPFVVMGEQPDASFVIVAAGIMPPEGPLSLAVPAMGPVGNGTPQFLVSLIGDNGGTIVAIDDPAERLWWDF
jgi:hypothetical protein